MVRERDRKRGREREIGESKPRRGQYSSFIARMHLYERVHSGQLRAPKLRPLVLAVAQRRFRTRPKQNWSKLRNSTPPPNSPLIQASCRPQSSNLLDSSQSSGLGLSVCLSIPRVSFSCRWILVRRAMIDVAIEQFDFVFSLPGA